MNGLPILTLLTALPVVGAVIALFSGRHARIVTLMAIDAANRVHHQPNVFFGLVLLLQAGLFGTFTALNFYHWFIYWEISLIPAFFLIKLWGGPRRGPAATQFFVYTMFGSVGLLLAFLAVFLSTGSMDFIHLADLASVGSNTSRDRSHCDIAIGQHAHEPIILSHWKSAEVVLLHLLCCGLQ